MTLQRIREASAVSLVLVALNYLGFYLFNWPLATEWVAEWIMARTPNTWSVAILGHLGEWAKPFAVTGGLATVGFGVWILMSAFRTPQFLGSRRSFLTSAIMTSGTVAVAVESYGRNQALASRTRQPVSLFPHPPVPDTFAPSLTRKPITPVGQFYVMSKNSVDPALDPDHWTLNISMDGKPYRRYSYRDLLSLPMERRYQTLRCISNTLKSDLMGTAEWAGVKLSQIINPRDIAEGVREMAVIGVDGHGDSFTLDYAWSEEPLLALGMNGNTLNRQHGYPVRLLVPRYYGFKNIKWIGEIRFTREPYFGTWPKMGYTKEPVIHTCSFIDRITREGSRLRAGGVAFSGGRSIERVEVRAGDGPWTAARLERPLSRYTLTRWVAELDCPAQAQMVEARALDSSGAWQSAVERPLFPDGMAGPTTRRIPS
jgi:DMSO/TMAO reductase YedYZ molybdopterin-dependent catalytic subunit